MNLAKGNIMTEWFDNGEFWKELFGNLDGNPLQP